MRKGWEIKKLGEVCKLITCGVAARPIYVDEGVPFLSAKNVKQGKIIYEGYNCISEETHKELTKNNKPLLGDILYTRVGSFGEAAVIEDEIEFSVFVSLTLIKTKREILYNHFLKYYLNSNEVKILAKSSITSSGVGNLNVGTVRQFPITLPPLPEQKRIVSILDEAFSSIEQAKENFQRNLQNAKELFQSEMNSIFTNKGEGWEEKKLGEVCETISDGDHQPPPKTEQGVPFITISNINKETNQIDFSHTYNVSTEYFEKIKQNRKPQKGDVLYTVTGSYGIPVLIDFEKDFCFQRHIGLIRPSNKLDKQFLFYWILSPNCFRQAHDSATGTAQKTVSLNSLRSFKISVPNLETQQKIVQQLDKLSTETKRLEAMYQQKLDSLEELKKSILQKAFSGELS